MGLLTSAATGFASRVSGGANVTVLPGTAIGFRFDSTIGFDFWEGSTFTSEGTPTRPITYAPVSLVQEGPFPSLASWAVPGYLISFLPDYWPNEAEDPPPVINFRFSNSSLNSGLSHHFLAGQPLWFFQGLDTGWTICSAAYLNLRDCQFNSGWWSLGEPNSKFIYPAAWGGPVIPGSVSLFNNSFNRVAMSLDPDTGPVYWWGPYEEVTMNVRLTATNNTFHGGWLFLEQVPATDETEENWVFKYNLFDKVAFAQQPERALHFDYNAYRKCRPADDAEPELLVGQTPRLSPPSINGSPDGDSDGEHDFDLTLAPLYRIGPLGSFYVDSGSPLQDATDINAAQLGLWHYTTRENQDKEGDLGTGVLDIGVHYVALDPATGLPKDSELPTADGIPDYVEDADGDGEWDEGVETKTNTDHTDTVHDSLNEVYDDNDLDGDGIGGLVEKRLNELNPQPLVCNEALSLTLDSSSQSEWRLLFLPPSEINLSEWKPRLSLNGQDCSAGCLVSETAPGQYDIVIRKGSSPEALLLQLVLRHKFAEFGPIRGSAVLIYNDSPLRTVPLANLFGSTLLVEAELAPNVESYNIRVFDESEAELASWASQNSGNRIDYSLDLASLNNGIGFSGEALDIDFELNMRDSVEPNTNPIRVRRRMIRGQTYNNAHMEVAYAWTDPPGSSAQKRRERMYQRGVSDIFFNPARNNQYYPTALNAFSTKVFYLHTVENAGDLFLDIQNWGLQNFFFSGHGSFETFGATAKKTDGLGMITIDDLTYRLENQMGDDGDWYTRKHPFRFVILHACETAQTDDLAISFGFNPVFSSVQDFQRRGLEPSAFVGWKTKSAVPSWYAPDFGEYEKSLALFTEMWMQERTLDDCLKYSSGKRLFLAYPLGFPLDKNYKIIGCKTLTRSGYAQ
jgi:hypothetical protein